MQDILEALGIIEITGRCIACNTEELEWAKLGDHLIAVHNLQKGDEVKLQRISKFKGLQMWAGRINQIPVLRIAKIKEK